jgi:putative two-component system response regulator
VEPRERVTQPQASRSSERGTDRPREGRSDVGAWFGAGRTIGAELGHARILIVDDSPENLLLLQTVLGQSGYTDLHPHSDPERALQVFDDRRPDLVLLDLHMGRISGFDLLSAFNQRLAPGEFLPIIVLTADVTTEVKRRALHLGATDFLTKPLDLMEVALRVRNLLGARKAYLDLARYQDHLEELVAERTADLELAQREVVERLALAAEYRDDVTGLHTRRVGELSAEIAVHLGLEGEEVELIRLATPLHDIGKIAIPDRILLKPGRLTEEEFEEVKLHVSIGADILHGSKSPLLQMAASVAMAHHERWDGMGYLGMAGEAIPQVARIVSVADVFDALISERPYKRAWSVPDALAEIEALRGRHFDPEVVDAFLDLMNPRTPEAVG